MKKIGYIACAAGCAAMLATGCVPLLAGGVVAGTAATATDRRSTGAQVGDGVLEKRVEWEIAQKVPEADRHITATAYNGKVLLSGEVKTEDEKETAGQVAKSSLDVASVVNALAVMEPAAVSQRLADSALATKVRSRVIGTSGISLNQMKVVSERGTVYLMGLVTREEGDIAASVAARTEGVKEVVKVFEYQSAAEIKERMRLLETQKEGAAQPVNP